MSKTTERPEGQKPWLGTPAQDVRAQIDAITAHLTAEGLIVTEEPPVGLARAFEGLHTLSVEYEGRRCFLRLNYQWLEDHSADAAIWLGRHGVPNALKAPDVAEITVAEAGMLSTRRS